VLDGLLARIQAILAHKLAGVYLYGSLAYGDFDLHNSDVDLLAVISSPLDEEELDRVHKLHQEIARTEPRWDDRIEVAYLTLDALRTFRTQASTIAIISPGEPFHTLDAGKDWLVNWYMVREHGVTLFGPPPQSVIAPIAKEEFIETIRSHTKSWAQWIEGCRYRGGQAYAVLTMCRALYTLAHGEQVSKVRAAAWAAHKYPQWATLIDNALRWRARSYDAAGEPSPETTFPETERFVHFAIEQSLSS
jgi:predicted nucleotidyltransferase